MSIKQLPGDVISQLKSSSVITSLNSVVCGLVHNSLDAEASKVNISVDYRRGSCSVEDDGLGIPPSEFQRDGFLGKVYSTSKYPPRSDCHGKYGTFIASVAALSLLSVTSHHHMHNSHNSLTIHNSKTLARHTPALPEQKILTFSHGTRVTVRDLFGSMPVRVKQRAVDAERQLYSKDWDQLVRLVVAILLAWPSYVSVNLREYDSRLALTLRTTESLSRRETQPERERNYVVRTARLLSQASLCDLADIESWIPIAASAPRISIDGCVSLTPVPTKRVQFVSIGIQPISNEYHSNVLHEEINRIFSNSSFSAIEDANEMSVEDRQKVDGFVGRELKARKGIDRWPMFYIRIRLESSAAQIPSEVDDILDDRRPDLAVIIDLLRVMFYEFLKRHHFRPKVVRPSLGSSAGQDRAVLSGPGSPSKRRRLGSADIAKKSSKDSGSGDTCASSQQLDHRDTRSSSPFSLWTRVKAGRPRVQTTKPVLRKTDSQSSTSERGEGSRPSTTLSPLTIPDRITQSTPSRPLVGSSGKLLRRPFDDFVVSADEKESTSESTRASDEEPLEPDQRETFVWEDPVSKIKSVVDSRTGFMVRPRQAPEKETAALLNPETGNPRNDQSGKGAPKDDPSPWLKDLLLSWENPVFELAEPSIPRLPDVSENLGGELQCSRRPCNDCNTLNTVDGIDQSSVNLPGRISKNTLRNAEVIAQVDQKFILAKVPMVPTDYGGQSNEGSGDKPCILVLIDQHAADERCRVESLMRDYFSRCERRDGSWTWKSCTTALDTPLHFDLSSQECRLLERFKNHFQRWGVFYDIIASETGKAVQRKDRGIKIRLLSLPPSIVERCRLEPRLAAELIRKEAWKLDELGWGVSDHQLVEPDEAVDHPWATRFHGCPQGILDIINSRACRNAIMFNDHMSISECAKLLERLSKCAFPFQCAHGRPSMIPILDLGLDVPHGIFEQEAKGSAFLEQFRQWKAAQDA